MRAGAGKACVALFAALLAACGASDAPGPGRHVLDRAGVLQAEAAPRMDRLYEGLLRDTDVDLIVLSVPSLEGRSLNDYANERFQRWKLGSRTRANRGLLLVLDTGGRQVRLHTSYELEALLTDGFISYVEHQMMVPYFEKNLPGPGLEATAELVARRLYEKILNRSFDPQQAGPSDIGGFHAGGGGAENPVPMGGDASAVAPPAPLGEEAAVEFAAPPTPAQAWEAFLNWNERHIKDTAIGLFDDKARRLFDSAPNADASQDHIARLYRGQVYEVRQEGDLAAVVFLDDPNHLLAPWFFKRGPEGWQLNGDMYPEAIMYDHLNRWGFRTDQHPYHFAFRDYDIRPGRLARRVNPGGAYIGLTPGYFPRQKTGTYVLSLVPNAPAERAGIEVGDLITTFDGRAIGQTGDFLRYMKESQPGQTVRLSILRGTLPREVTTYDREGRPGVFHPRTGGLAAPQPVTVNVTLGSR